MAEPNKRQLQREGTLARIDHTVNQLVVEKGFEEMRIQDICERAGISTGAFYHHFSSKQDILFERYLATVQLMDALSEEAERMEPVEAAQYLVREATEYTRSRVPQVLESYLKAHLQRKEEWSARCPEIPLWQRVRKCLERAKQTGAIAPETDLESICRLIETYYPGVTLEQCFSQGRFLAENRPEEDICRLLEQLRTAQP